MTEQDTFPIPSPMVFTELYSEIDECCGRNTKALQSHCCLGCQSRLIRIAQLARTLLVPEPGDETALLVTIPLEARK